MNPYGLTIIMMIMRYSIWGLLMSCDALWCLVLSLLSARFQHGRLRAAIGGGQPGVAQVSQGILSNNLELYIICPSLEYLHIYISTYNIYIYIHLYYIYLLLLLLHNNNYYILLLIPPIGKTMVLYWIYSFSRPFFLGDRAASASCLSFTVSTTAFSSWQDDHHHPIWGERSTIFLTRPRSETHSSCPWNWVLGRRLENMNWPPWSAMMCL